MNLKTQQKLLNIVKQNYEEIAEDFSQTRNYIWPELKKLVEDLWFPKPCEVSETKETKVSETKILDIGCGNGRMLDLFEGKDIEYTGIEQSRKLVEKAKDKCRERGGKCKITEGDILCLDKFVKGRFDLILCIAVLHHIPSKELRLQVLRQMKNHLAEGGQCIITVWNLRSQKKHRKLVWKYAILKMLGFNRMDFGDILFDWKNSRGEKVAQRYYHAFKKKELQKLLNKSGLKIERLYSDRKNIYAICNT